MIADRIERICRSYRAVKVRNARRRYLNGDMKNRGQQYNKDFEEELRFIYERCEYEQVKPEAVIRVLGLRV